jgi:hypothetical protein
MDEGRKRVLLIAASILAARKLAQYDGGKRVPATVAPPPMRSGGLRRLWRRLIGGGHRIYVYNIRAPWMSNPN